jgi:hypothetical protein
LTELHIGRIGVIVFAGWLVTLGLVAASSVVVVLLGP